jgi:NadR type nicotinamide-nucleotide adenylyltransferase
MVRNAVILMTALVPTLGHKALIDFALSYAGYVDVIVSGRSFEPVSIDDRIAALEEHYENEPSRLVFIKHFDDDAPQNPSTDEEWDYWKNIVLNNDIGEYEYDCIIASEPYGKKMAELIGAEFVPFDPDRNFIDVKGTKVREQIAWRYDDLLPEFARKMRKVITFFGQESCGKSTMTKLMNKEYVSYMTHEFARPYLEAMDDKTVTHEKMCNIADGQYALEKIARDKTDRPFLFQDTDLLSTIGYNRIYKGEPIDFIETRFNRHKADLYIVMNDEIPFVEDDLRYGGKVRESTKQFWIDLLEEFGCKYYVVKSTDIRDQEREIWDRLDELFDATWTPIKNFKRD